MFEAVPKKVEGNMFSESLLEEAKVLAYAMLESGKEECPLSVGKEGNLLLTIKREGHGSILASFPMSGTVVYVVLPSSVN